MFVKQYVCECFDPLQTMHVNHVTDSLVLEKRLLPSCVHCSTQLVLGSNIGLSYLVLQVRTKYLEQNTEI